jgi:hypothetical protein
MAEWVLSVTEQVLAVKFGISFSLTSQLIPLVGMLAVLEQHEDPEAPLLDRILMMAVAWVGLNDDESSEKGKRGKRKPRNEKNCRTRQTLRLTITEQEQSIYRCKSVMILSARAGIQL